MLNKILNLKGVALLNTQIQKQVKGGNISEICPGIGDPCYIPTVDCFPDIEPMCCINGYFQSCFGF